MWMTRELITVTPDAPLAEVASIMARRRIRRLPVVPANSRRLAGIVSYSDVLHAFPANLNPFSADAAEQLAQSQPGRELRASALMARQVAVTTADAPIESAARLMRQHKVGALPVLQGDDLVGLITESDIFRALVEMFEPAGRTVRITFQLRESEDVLPLLADIAKRRDMRVNSFFALPRHEPPMAVVQMSGAHIEESLEDVWQSRHRVMNVAHLERGVPPSAKP
jgi:acetoin utilization protein AcuB